MSEMTRKEREDLAALTRKRERVAKTQARERSAHLLAEVEARLSDRFSREDVRWRDVVERAEGEMDRANATIVRVCEEQGIPVKFALRLAAGWYGRGDNRMNERRVELRKLAQTRVAALEKAAFAAIEAA